jgi:hypothetical protein
VRYILIATPEFDVGEAGTIVDTAGIAMVPRRPFGAPLEAPAKAGLLNGALPKMGRSRVAVQIRFIALLKPPFKSSDDYRDVGSGKKEPANTGKRTRQKACKAMTGEYHNGSF